MQQLDRLDVTDRHYDRKYQDMQDRLDTLIERIDLFPERQENGSILKRIRFKFRVDYDAEAGGKVLLNENDVETVCLLQIPSSKVN